MTHQLSAHGVARTQWQLVEDGALLAVELRHTAGVLGQTFGVDHSIEVSRFRRNGHPDVVAITFDSNILAYF